VVKLVIQIPGRVRRATAVIGPIGGVVHLTRRKRRPDGAREDETRVRSRHDGFVFAPMQFFPAPRRLWTSRDVRTIQASLSMPGEVRTILGKACSNCQLERDGATWYARVAPASWTGCSRP